MTVGQRPIEHLHGFEIEVVEHGPRLLPQLAFTAEFFPNRSKEGTAKLLDLIDKESEHHEHHEVGGEVLFTQAEVVLKMILMFFNPKNA